MSKISQEAEDNRPRKPANNFFRYRAKVTEDVKKKFP